MAEISTNGHSNLSKIGMLKQRTIYDGCITAHVAAIRKRNPITAINGEMHGLYGHIAIVADEDFDDTQDMRELINIEVYLT